MVVRSSVAILLCVLFATQATAQVDTRPQSAALPGAAALEDGWNSLTRVERRPVPRERPITSTRDAVSEKLLVFFEGGGACWTGEDCERGRPAYEPEVATPGPGADRSLRGILDLSHPENPFADHSAVIVGDCTGDVHLGDRAATYTSRATAALVHSRSITAAR